MQEKPSILHKVISLTADLKILTGGALTAHAGALIVHWLDYRSSLLAYQRWTSRRRREWWGSPRPCCGPRSWQCRAVCRARPTAGRWLPLLTDRRGWSAPSGSQIGTLLLWDTRTKLSITSGVLLVVWYFKSCLWFTYLLLAEQRAGYT